MILISLLFISSIFFYSCSSDDKLDLSVSNEPERTSEYYINLRQTNLNQSKSTVEIQWNLYSSDDFESYAIVLDQDSTVLDINTITASVGEWTIFDLSLHNYGYGFADNVIAELSSSSDHATIEESIVHYGDINSGSYVIKSFDVYIHGTAFNGEDLQFQLSISDENNNWINYVPVNIVGPKLYVQEYIGDVSPGNLVNISLDIN